MNDECALVARDTVDGGVGDELVDEAKDQAEAEDEQSRREAAVPMIILLQQYYNSIIILKRDRIVL